MLTLGGMSDRPSKRADHSDSCPHKLVAREDRRVRVVLAMVALGCVLSAAGTIALFSIGLHWYGVAGCIFTARLLASLVSS